MSGGPYRSAAPAPVEPTTFELLLARVRVRRDRRSPLDDELELQNEKWSSNWNRRAILIPIAFALSIAAGALIVTVASSLATPAATPAYFDAVVTSREAAVELGAGAARCAPVAIAGSELERRRCLWSARLGR